VAELQLSPESALAINAADQLRTWLACLVEMKRAGPVSNRCSWQREQFEAVSWKCSGRTGQIGRLMDEAVKQFGNVLGKRRSDPAPDCGRREGLLQIDPSKRRGFVRGERRDAGNAGASHEGITRRLTGHGLQAWCAYQLAQMCPGVSQYQGASRPNP